MIICTSDQFFVDDYVRHNNNGNLTHGLMVYCKDPVDIERVRKRILGYARTRNQIVQCEKTDNRHLHVKIMGVLHLDK